MDLKNIPKKYVIIISIVVGILIIGTVLFFFIFLANNTNEVSVKKVNPKGKIEEVRKWSATIISDDIPETMKVGEKRLFKIIVKNTGFIAWDNSLGDFIGLKAVDYTHPWRIVEDNNYQVELIGKAVVYPGKTHQYSILVKAPDKVGSKLFHWRMYKVIGDKGWNFFGADIKKEINITN